MKISENTIHSVSSWFHDELDSIYGKSEVRAMLTLCFQELLGISGSERISRSKEGLSEFVLAEFVRIVKNLKDEKPLQYLLGYTWFYGLKFKVNPHVLIPRPETEELVDLIIKENKDTSRRKILDIGTGSGCIPVSLKSNLPLAEVSALDISLAALDVANENAKMNKVDVNFFLFDILEKDVEKVKGAYDIIISNPPYISTSEIQTIGRNVLDNEPHLALFVSDDDPLVFFRTISGFAIKKLNPGGILYFEINEKFGEEVKNILLEDGWMEVDIKKDINGRNRIVSACLKLY